MITTVTPSLDKTLAIMLPKRLPPVIRAIYCLKLNIEFMFFNGIEMIFFL
jgi:hypothetical protein